MVPIQQKPIKANDQAGKLTKRKQESADDLQMSKREKLRRLASDFELSTIDSSTRSDSEIMMAETSSVDGESIPCKVKNLFSAKELEWCKGRGLFEALKAELSVSASLQIERLLTVLP